MRSWLDVNRPLFIKVCAKKTIFTFLLAVTLTFDLYLFSLAKVISHVNRVFIANA